MRICSLYPWTTQSLNVSEIIYGRCEFSHQRHDSLSRQAVMMLSGETGLEGWK